MLQVDSSEHASDGASLRDVVLDIATGAEMDTDEASSSGSSNTIADLGVPGEPMLYAMLVVYGALIVLGCVMYIAWVDPRSMYVKREHPDMGLPVGYT